jgi:hypothetical protein
VEVPGDGVDNDDVAGEVAIDESVGLFFDSEAGDDANPGTRAQPLRSFTAVPAGYLDHAFLAARPTPYGGNQILHPLQGYVGGLDPVTWQRIPNSRSTVLVPVTAFLVDSVETNEVTYARGVVSSRLAVFAPLTETTSTLYDSTIVSLEIPYGTARCMHSDVDRVSIATNGGATLVGVRVLQDTTMRDSATVQAVNTIFVGPIRTNSTATSIDLFHCDVLAGIVNQGNVHAVATRFAGTAAAITRSDPGLDSYELYGNHFEHTPGGVLVTGRGVNVLSVAELDTTPCFWAGVCQSAGNSDSVGLNDASVMDLNIDATAQFAPPSVAADINGNCRYADGAADTGAVEFP